MPEILSPGSAGNENILDRRAVVAESQVLKVEEVAPSHPLAAPEVTVSMPLDATIASAHSQEPAEVSESSSESQKEDPAVLMIELNSTKPKTTPDLAPAETPVPPVMVIRRRRSLRPLIIAAVITLMISGAAAIGSWWYRRAAVAVDAPAIASRSATSQSVTAPPIVVVAKLDAPVSGGLMESLPSTRGTVIPELPLQGVPGAGPEPELETRLRLAAAGSWRPQEDFGSPEAVIIARHKIDAVRNSISAYRIDMQRQNDSVHGTAAYQRSNEPFDETVKISAALKVVESTVQLLDSLRGNFRVSGNTLSFSRSLDADRWNGLRAKAESILALPVELDPYPGTIRPPRRVVTRLVASLPAGR